MEVEIILNGNIALVLIPKNPMEEEILKNLAAQKNEIITPRDGITVLGRIIHNAMVIKAAKVETVAENNNQEPKSSEAAAEDL